jgi:adenosylmethionine-8-amino-7-oxononanoate aminotransferase
VGKTTHESTRAKIVARDKAHVWHPYTPMGDWIAHADPIVVRRARGATLEDHDGSRYLDGNASWWTAALGHGHPRIVRTIAKQAAALAHCSLAGIAHEPAALLAEELCAAAPEGLTRVFYTDNGSTAIELAIKMAIQFWQQRGASKKTRFLALDGAFHGDTVGAASLSGIEIFRRPFGGVLFECVRAPSPADDAFARAFDVLSHLVEKEAPTLAAVFVEPIVQAASGMRVYAPEHLRQLRDACTEHGVLFVADEVFTGYGRTGPMWACEHAGVAPDLMCVGKAFAAPIPMGATLATERVFSGFLGGRDRALWYGHTFCGNPLGAAVAREVLAVYRDEKLLDRVARIAPKIAAAFDRIGRVPGVARARAIGAIGAADLSAQGYEGTLGWRVYEEARRRGAYLRPLGDTVYVCPPLVITDADLARLLEIVEASVRATVT